MAKRFVVAAISLVVALSVAGCSGGSAKSVVKGSTSGQDKTAGAAGTSTESTTTQAEPYVALAPESANEKQAIANVGATLKAFAANQKASNQQNGTDTYIFTNTEGYKPLFVGHELMLLTGKQDDGTFGFASILVLGDKVTSPAYWDKSAAISRDNGMINMATFKIAPPSDPLAFTKTFAPQSPAEKNAVAVARKWMADNVADLGFKDAKLTGYVFLYGQPGDRPNAVLSITPDGTGYGATVAEP
ncbi:MAG: hypothetical protein CVT67_08660 [Actinobacteria bacterium HGW-Actinobacteria-7]|nr:MAG: hypothetical protein CVT67_08660 [Actinobacteria bacterium HGW-Actinobacteria-7]